MKRKNKQRYIRRKEEAVLSEVVSVRISGEEKERIDKLMMHLGMTRYSDVMRLALDMMKPHVGQVHVS